MSTAIASPVFQRPPPLRWTGTDFDRADAMGLFDGKRVELMDGEILEMPSMNDPHAQAIQLGTYALLGIFPPTHATLRVQCPMRLGEFRPIPDFVVVAGIPRQVVEHPTSALLIVEISDSSLEYDRGAKARLYAAHGIPDYWIVNLNGRCVEVRRNPIGADIGDPHYSHLQVHSLEQSLAPLAAPQTQLKVADLLP
ncbi:MAG TPA: Uma2 family endonuclease [Tepidisphaeraceae bacterium]|nr:Uma2 family endonuclease [Tepidisphaeraceae bacterium]